MFFMHQPLYLNSHHLRGPSRLQQNERDEALRPLQQRYNLAKVKHDKVMMRDLEKQIKAVNDRYMWF